MFGARAVDGQNSAACVEPQALLAEHSAAQGDHPLPVFVPVGRSVGRSAGPADQAGVEVPGIILQFGDQFLWRRPGYAAYGCGSIGVCVVPGQTSLQRILCAAVSSPSPRVNATAPALDATQAAIPARGTPPRRRWRRR